MGDEQHSAPGLATYLSVLRRRVWVVLLFAILVPSAAAYFSARQTPQYEASADVYINKQNLANAVTGVPETPLNDAQRELETQAKLAAVPEVALRALKMARLEDRSAEEFLTHATVAPNGLTDLLNFSFVDPDPRIAMRLANAHAKAFTVYRGSLDTQPLVRAHREASSTLAQMRREGRQDTPLYQSLEQSQQQLQTLQTLQTSRASLVRQATEATQIAPRTARNVVLGLALGLVLGLGLAFLFEALDTRIRSAGEVAERLGLTLLARLPAPMRKLQRRDQLVMIAEPRDPRAESFRMLGTNLEFATLGSDVRSVLVTSAVQAEGKSTTAANLAVTLARAGKRVALVDLDLRKPYLHRFFGLGGSRGVTNVALGDASLEEALTPVDLDDAVGELYVLPTGPLPPDPGEFVGTYQLREILVRLREEFDMLVIDSPPLLRVGDAMRLSASVDGVLVVTQLNLVRRRTLAELKHLLDAIPARKLGFVVTGSRGDDVAYGYAYGYGYGHDGDRPGKQAASGTAAPR